MSSISFSDLSREYTLLIPVTSVRLTALIGVSLILDQLCRLGLTIAAGVSSLDTFSMFFSNWVCLGKMMVFVPVWTSYIVNTILGGELSGCNTSVVSI